MRESLRIETEILPNIDYWENSLYVGAIHTEISINIYHEVKEKIRYTELLKSTLCQFLDKSADYSRCKMLVSVSDYHHVLACIREAIDEMFYEEISEAKKIKESYENENWQHCKKEYYAILCSGAY